MDITYFRSSTLDEAEFTDTYTLTKSLMLGDTVHVAMNLPWPCGLYGRCARLSMGSLQQVHALEPFVKRWNILLASGYLPRRNLVLAVESGVNPQSSSSSSLSSFSSLSSSARCCPPCPPHCCPICCCAHRCCLIPPRPPHCPPLCCCCPPPRFPLCCCPPRCPPLPRCCPTTFPLPHCPPLPRCCPTTFPLPHCPLPRYPLHCPPLPCCCPPHCPLPRCCPPCCCPPCPLPYCTHPRCYPHCPPLPRCCPTPCCLPSCPLPHCTPPPRCPPPPPPHSKPTNSCKQLLDVLDDHKPFKTLSRFHLLTMKRISYLLLKGNLTAIASIITSIGEF